MQIRVFPSSEDHYNSIVIDTDNFDMCPSFGHTDDFLPSVNISDLISELIYMN